MAELEKVEIPVGNNVIEQDAELPKSHEDQQKGEDFTNDVQKGGQETCENDDASAKVPLCSTAGEDKSLSKNQRKKLLKRQRYIEERKLRKLRKKEKQKEKRLKRELEGEETEPRQLPKKIKTMGCEDALPVRIAIDLGFDDLMTDRDILKLMKQVQRCYAVNRRATHPVQLHLTSFEGRSKERLDFINCHYEKWDVHLKTESLTNVFPKEDIVYLTSDSPNVISDLDMTKVYVIGGLVDHNHHKGYCFQQAVKQGFGHAQLPLEEFIQIVSRKVLAVNHVFEILVSYCENKDWKKAFLEAVPQRKVIPKVRRHGRNREQKAADAADSSSEESEDHS